MAKVKIPAPRIAGISTCVPAHRFDNLKDTTEFSEDEVRKVVAMAGVSARHTADDSICSSDLCFAAAKALLEKLNWATDSIDALIMVTQTPDYFLPSTACVLHERLGLPDQCAAFDLGQGCSGYPYGLWMATMMLSCDLNRVLLLHGETPSRFAAESDRSVSLLFGDAGSATALETAERETEDEWSFVLQTDGRGYNDLIIEGGGFRNRFCTEVEKNHVHMNGANIFNFTIKRVPPLISDTLELAGVTQEEMDYFVFHQSNRFIMKHLAQKMKLPAEKVPIILDEYGNAGGPSVPLTITRGKLERPVDRALKLILVGYGVGLSWASALVELEPKALLCHQELS